MADDDSNPPADDFGATTLGAPVFDLEELARAAGQPTAAPAAAKAKEREVVGPAWAGTLTGLDPAPLSSPFPVEPPPPAPPPPLVRAEAAEPPEDLAATSLHRRAVPIPVGPPIRDLPPKRGAAAQPAGSGPRRLGAPPPASDTPLKIGLAVLVGLIALLVVGLIAGLVYELSAPDPASMDQPEQRTSGPRE